MANHKVQEKTNTLEMYTKVLFMMRSSWCWLAQQFHTCCYKFVVNNTDHVLTNSVFFLVILSFPFSSPPSLGSFFSYYSWWGNCSNRQITRTIWHLLLFLVRLDLSYSCILHLCSCMISIFILQVSEKLAKHLSKISAVLEKVWIASSFPSCKIFFPLADCTLESNWYDNDCTNILFMLERCC